MPNPSPSPPPLPPPTVPSQNPLPHSAPPQPNHPPSPSSDSHSPSVPMHPHKDPPQQSEDDYPKKHRRRACCCHFRLRPTPHHIREPATSVWFDTRVLLLFRLAVTAILLGHLVFFSLRGDFSYRLYSTWNYVGLSLAFLLVVMASLLDILRDEDSYNDDDIGTTQGEGMVTDVERQPVGRPPLPDPKLARPLTSFTVPLYQIFVTSTLFGTIVYWAAIHDSSTVPISYPLMMLKAFAPAAALLDFLLSFRMRFRLLYVVLYTLYNGAYAGALVLFHKLQEDPVYPIFDPSVQSSKDFIGKTAGIAAASVAAGLLMYAFSYLPVLPCFTAKNELAKKKRESVDGSDISPTTASDDTSDSSGMRPLDITARDPNRDAGALRNGSRREDGLSWHSRSIQKNDRLSLPISGSGAMTTSTSTQWFRSSSAKFAASRSGSSIGSDDRQDSFPRNDSEKRSTWDELNQPAMQIEDEYFAMPAVSSEREVIKLKPMPRNESVTSLPGILSRSSSGRMSRSGSRRISRSESYRMSRSGSRKVLERSHSDRAGAAKSFSRNGSSGSLR